MYSPERNTHQTPLNKPVLFHSDVDSVGTNLPGMFMPLEKLETQSTKLKILKVVVIQEVLGQDVLVETALRTRSSYLSKTGNSKN